MRFECYSNKTVVIEVPTVNSELAESAINSGPIIAEPEPEIKIETTSDITEKVSTPLCSELNEDVAELPKEEATPFTINNIPIAESNQPSEYEIFRANAIEHRKKN